METARITIDNWPQSARCRAIVRRNYRWLRRDGVRPATARIILASTLRIANTDEMHARYEASR